MQRAHVVAHVPNGSPQSPANSTAENRRSGAVVARSMIRTRRGCMAARAACSQSISRYAAGGYPPASAERPTMTKGPLCRADLRSARRGRNLVASDSSGPLPARCLTGTLARGVGRTCRAHT